MFIITGEGVEYNPGQYINVNITVGFTNASFDIIINNDNVLEDDRRVNISITSITNGHNVGISTVVSG